MKPESTKPARHRYWLEVVAALATALIGFGALMDAVVNARGLWSDKTMATAAITVATAVSVWMTLSKSRRKKDTNSRESDQ